MIQKRAREEVIESGAEEVPGCRVTELRIWEAGHVKLNLFNVVAPDGLCFSVGKNLTKN